MINAVRELRAMLVDHKMLAANHTMLPHQQMPGAATACPGNAVLAAWPLLTAPWAPTPPPPSEDPDMYLATLSDGSVVVVGSSVRPVSPEEIAAGGPYTNMPRYVPAPTSYWHLWLRAGLDEYSARVMG
jgi:hypothetical protein